MTQVCEFLFWFGVSWLAYVYVGYPLLVGFLAKFLPHPVDSAAASGQASPGRLDGLAHQAKDKARGATVQLVT